MTPDGDDVDVLIAAPDDPGAWSDWHERLTDWRDESRRSLGHDGAAFTNPAFAWVSDCISTHKILLWDQRFYDRDHHEWRVDAYVDDFEQRFGVLDGVILWHAYPNLGFDRRNQFDFYRRMPGGLDGLRDAVDRLHARGVRVLLDYNPWDQATRREARPDHVVLAELVAALDADGLYLDTMAEAASDLRAALDAVRPGLVLESQSFTPLDRIADHHMSWAEVYRDRPVPGVLRNAWFERRQMLHLVHRWIGDHRSEMQLALMNGAGMVVWENVFGSWNGWSGRDAVWLKLWSAVRHRHARHFTDGVWSPLAVRPAEGVFASAWDLDGIRLWTIVNRRESWAHDVPLDVTADQAADLMAGRDLEASDGRVLLDLPPHGMTAVCEGVSDARFLTGQRTRWLSLPDASSVGGSRAVVALGPGATVCRQRVPDGMVRCGGGTRERRVVMRCRECGDEASASAPDCESHTLPGLHDLVERTVRDELEPFAITPASITCAEFRIFVETTGYRPRHDDQFLEEQGQGDDPVVFIDPDDARAYAAWRGSRLPTEAEWQCAAEGGFLADDSVRVWNWTGPERSDGRTRFCMLKGGADFEARGSRWYPDGGPKEPAFASKYLLLWPGLDRCATIGFRVVAESW